MRRCPRHEYSPRFEQRPELLVGRTRPERRRPNGWLTDFDQTVDGDEVPARLDDQWVDVDAGHIVPIGREPPETDEQLDQLLTVDRRFSSEIVEQLLRGESADHVVGRRCIEWRWAEHDIGDGFRENPTDAEHDHRPELSIPNDSGDQLAVTRDHRCDEYVDVAVVGPGCGEQFSRSGLDGRTITEAQFDEPTLGLVGDRVAVQLRDDGISDLVGRGASCSRRLHESFRSDRHAVLGEERLRGAFGQSSRSRHRVRS